jgi:hypothetical protein
MATEVWYAISGGRNARGVKGFGSVTVLLGSDIVDRRLLYNFTCNKDDIKNARVIFNRPSIFDVVSSSSKADVSVIYTIRQRFSSGYH